MLRRIIFLMAAFFRCAEYYPAGGVAVGCAGIFETTRHIVSGFVIHLLNSISKESVPYRYAALHAELLCTMRLVVDASDAEAMQRV